MSLKRFTRPILTGLIFILMMSLLPGFKGQQTESVFYAPIKQPAAMIYHNLEVSGIYNRDETAKTALAEIKKNINSLLKNKIKNQNHNKQSLFLDKFLNQNQHPKELYFYFKNSEKFAFILAGEFDINRLSQQLVKDDAVNGRLLIELFLENSKVKALKKLVLWADSQRLLLCPEAASQELISRLLDKRDYLDSKFKAFKKMLKGKPALAGEVDLELLKQSMASSSIRIPKTLNVLKHLRFIGDARLTKAQLYAPENKQREQLFKEIDNSLEVFNNLFNKVATFSIKSKGNSLFLEAEAGIEMERILSRKVSAFILHFFENRDTPKKIVLTSKVANEEKE